MHNRICHKLLFRYHLWILSNFNTTGQERTPPPHPKKKKSIQNNTFYCGPNYYNNLHMLNRVEGNLARIPWRPKAITQLLICLSLPVKQHRTQDGPFLVGLLIAVAIWHKTHLNCMGPLKQKNVLVPTAPKMDGEKWNRGRGFMKKRNLVVEQKRRAWSPHIITITSFGTNIGHEKN